MLQYEMPPEFEKKYELIPQNRLGGGAFGQVYKVKDKVSQNFYAAKIIHIASFKDRQLLEYTRQEVNLMKELTEQRCQNIIKFIESFEDQGFIVIIMELCDDSLQRVFQQQEQEFIFQASLYVLIQISIGIKSLHYRNTMHRDLKLGNIMVNKNNQNNILKYEIKLIDFGFAKELQLEDLTQTLVGTDATMAPEVRNGEKYHISADIYSLGVICYQLMTGSTIHETITSEDKDTIEFLTYVKKHMLCKQSERDQISQVIKYMESKVVKIRKNHILQDQENGSDQEDRCKYEEEPNTQYQDKEPLIPNKQDYTYSIQSVSSQLEDDQSQQPQDPNQISILVPDPKDSDQKTNSNQQSDDKLNPAQPQSSSNSCLHPSYILPVLIVTIFLAIAFSYWLYQVIQNSKQQGIIQLGQNKINTFLSNAPVIYDQQDIQSTQYDSDQSREAYVSSKPKSNFRGSDEGMKIQRNQVPKVNIEDQSTDSSDNESKTVTQQKVSVKAQDLISPGEMDEQSHSDELALTIQQPIRKL